MGGVRPPHLLSSLFLTCSYDRDAKVSNTITAAEKETRRKSSKTVTCPSVTQNIEKAEGTCVSDFPTHRRFQNRRMASHSMRQYGAYGVLFLALISLVKANCTLSVRNHSPFRTDGEMLKYLLFRSVHGWHFISDCRGLNKGK